MNKIYQAPELRSLTIDIQSIICSSPATPGIQDGSADTSTEQDGGGYMLTKEHTNAIDWNDIWE